MILQTAFTIAFKCSICGSFKFNKCSLFELYRKKQMGFSCCCKSSLLIQQQAKGNIDFMASCMACGNVHIHRINKGYILKAEKNIFRCPPTGIQYVFVGNNKDVLSLVDNYEQELDALMDKCGFEQYFVNNQVMIDSLNKIHDLAWEGNLYCVCGSNDIEMELLPDKIELKCRKCPGSRIIYAGSNKDLENIVVSKKMFLS